MIKVGFIGAGSRANQAHYPAVARLDGVVIEAISALSTGRLNATADRYGVRHRYTDHRRMLAEADLDAVYVITPPRPVLSLVLDCLQAGKHVFVEKPPGLSVAELERMIDAAERGGRLTAVCFQRRFAAVAEEARRLVLARGPVTLCQGEFHKHLLTAPGPEYGVGTLVEDLIHAVDFVRFMCNGEAVAVHAFQDRLFAEWTNCYNALIRFSTGAVGIVSGNRSSGTRLLRFTVHGRGIVVDIDMPDRLRVWSDGAAEPVVVTGAQLAARHRRDDHEGTLALHRHFVECIGHNRQPSVSFQACLGTMRLVELMEERDR